MDSPANASITAAQIKQLEDGSVNPLTNKPYPPPQKTLLQTRRKLPVYVKCQEFLDIYQKSPVVVLSSDTGSGKSTQIPQFIVHDEPESKLGVVCTQPRVLAATSLAKRVAAEMGVQLGREVGYHVRFDRMRDDKITRLTYLTEGVLIRELLTDSLLKKYRCVIIDEAHERTTNTDILMGLLQDILSRRKDFKVVIMSATLDAVKFQGYFNNAPILHISGRAHPVQVFHTRGETSNFPNSATSVVVDIHTKEGPGDILVFLSGEDDIERVCRVLRQNTKGLAVLPLYSQMQAAAQQKIYETIPGARKCIVSTNIAETSLTIDGLKYVVDSGMSKQMSYNPRTRAHQLRVQPISKAAANQRLGRAGRTQPGVCYRLYTKVMYDAMLQSNLPSIYLDPLDSAILAVKAAGHLKFLDFNFIDRPQPESVLSALEDLHGWGYINPDGSLTDDGKSAALCPLDPIWYRAIKIGGKFGCSREIADIAVLCSTQQSIFVRPSSHRHAADLVRMQFSNALSDQITLLNAYRAYCRAFLQDEKNVGQWCYDHFLNRRVLEEAYQMRAHLGNFLREDKRIRGTSTTLEDHTSIRRALAEGFFTRTAIFNKGYRTVHGNTDVLVSPNSTLVSWSDSRRDDRPTDDNLVGVYHEWVMYDSIQMSGLPYLQMVTAIKAEWLVDLPFFQDEALPVKGTGQLRQPQVKASLDQARLRIDATGALTT